MLYMICSKSEQRRSGCESSVYETTGCEETDEDGETIDCDEKSAKVTINNIHLTINISVDSHDKDKTKQTENIVVKNENSEKLLNIIHNVLNENEKLNQSNL